MRIQANLLRARLKQQPIKPMTPLRKWFALKNLEFDNVDDFEKIKSHSIVSLIIESYVQEPGAEKNIIKWNAVNYNYNYKQSLTGTRLLLKVPFIPPSPIEDHNTSFAVKGVESLKIDNCTSPGLIIAVLRVVGNKFIVTNSTLKAMFIGSFNGGVVQSTEMVDMNIRYQQPYPKRPIDHGLMINQVKCKRLRIERCDGEYKGPTPSLNQVESTFLIDVVNCSEIDLNNVTTKKLKMFNKEVKPLISN